MGHGFPGRWARYQRLCRWGARRARRLRAARRGLLLCGARHRRNAGPLRRAVEQPTADRLPMDRFAHLHVGQPAVAADHALGTNVELEYLQLLRGTTQVEGGPGAQLVPGGRRRGRTAAREQPKHPAADEQTCTARSSHPMGYELSRVHGLMVVVALDAPGAALRAVYAKARRAPIALGLAPAACRHDRHRPTPGGRGSCQPGVRSVR